MADIINYSEIQEAKLRSPKPFRKPRPVVEVVEDDESVNRHNDLDLEESLIHAIMHNPGGLLGLKQESGLPAELFYHDKPRKMYEALSALYAETGEGGAVKFDFPLMKAALTKLGYYAAVKEGQAVPNDKVGAVDIMRCYNHPTASSANLKAYAKQIRALALRRELVRSAREIIEMTKSEETASSDILSEVQKKAIELSTGIYDDSSHRYTSMLSDDLGFMERYSEEDRAKMRRLPVTGIAGFDGSPGKNDAFALLNAGAVSCIFADTNNGKTSLALQIFLMSLARGLNAAYLTVEETRESLRLRMISSISQVPLMHINLHLAGRRQLTASEIDAYNKAVRALKGEEVEINGEWHSYGGQGFIMECNGFGGKRIAQELTARHEMAKSSTLYGKRGFELIVVDYIQGTGPNPNLKRSDNLEAIMGENMRDLEKLAIRTGASVVVTSQINPDYCDKDEKLGVLLARKEAGKYGKIIGHIADQVFALAVLPDRNQAVIRIAKSRQSPVGNTLIVEFYGARYKFS